MKQYDLIFVAQLIERKCPMFVVQLMNRMPNRSILAIGDGPLRTDFVGGLSDSGCKYTWIPKVRYEDIPSMFAKAKICLFPTLLDTWGLVANEALAADCPVITTANAGCAGELVLHGVNGSILPLDVDMWVKDINWILDNYDDHLHWLDIDGKLWLYTRELAASQIVAACEIADEGRRYRNTKRIYEEE